VKRTGEGGGWRRCYYSGMDDALRVIRTFINNFDAEIARSALEAAGIDAMIRSDDCGGTRPHLWMGGVELLVRAEDAAEADELLGTEPVPTESRDDAAE
jgi:putative signal transducing protein